MEITQFVISLISFAVMLAGTLMSVGWFAGKLINGFEKSITEQSDRFSEKVSEQGEKFVGEIKELRSSMSTMSTNIETLSTQVHMLGDNVKDTNRTVRDIDRRVDSHDVRLAVIEKTNGDCKNSA